MERWLKQTEEIRQLTGLPIVCMQTSRSEAARIRLQQEQLGWELAATAEENGAVSLVLIDRASWHPSARALLGLFFAPQLARPKPPFMDQVTAWLQSIANRSPAPAPAGIELWSWREKRAVFLIERCRSESASDWQSLQPMLHDFFKGQPASLSLFPLSPHYYLLLVPLSMLGIQSDRLELLEWASGLHDLISTEQMENVRLLVGMPIATPLLLEESLGRLLALSQALARFLPRVMVAASWNYPLEQWAAALPADTSRQLMDCIESRIAAHPLSAEQRETLETFFRCQLNISDTARQLHLHRNTLLYRLDKLAEQTGLDPRQFSHAVLFKLLLLFRQN